jgi:K+-sensing histidine kinase KdpD
MPRSASSSIARYGVALLSVAVAFFARLFCDHWLEDRSALDFFLAATAVSAWFGGAGPSIASILLSTLLGLWYFVEPRHRC